MPTIIPDRQPTAGDVAELSARRTAAAAVLLDFRAAEAAFSRGAAQPAYAAWALRLSQHLGYVLGALEAFGEPDAAGDQGDAAEDLEPFCATCGAAVGIFIGHGDAWLHYTGQGTAASPVELYDAGHAPEVAWRQAGAR